MSGAVLDTDQAQSGINSDLALPLWQFSESCPLTSKSRYSPLWERFFKHSSYWNWNSKYPHSSTSLLLIHRNRSVPFSKTNNSGFTFNLYSRLPWIILSLKIPFSCHRQAYSPSLFFEKKRKEKLFPDSCTCWNLHARHHTQKCQTILWFDLHYKTVTEVLKVYTHQLDLCSLDHVHKILCQHSTTYCSPFALIPPFFKWKTIKGHNWLHASKPIVPILFLVTYSLSEAHDVSPSWRFPLLSSCCFCWDIYSSSTPERGFTMDVHWSMGSMVHVHCTPLSWS